MSTCSVVELNVGGVIYTTTDTTLTKYPDSMLGAMFSGTMPTTRDQQGRFFIDRNGELFQHVLDYLRFGKLPPEANPCLLSRLALEADFYQVQPLIDDIQGFLTPQEKQVDVLEINMILEGGGIWALRIFGDEDMLDDIPIPKHFCVTRDNLLPISCKFLEWKNEYAFCCSLSTRIEAYLRSNSWMQTSKLLDKGLFVTRWVKTSSDCSEETQT